MFCAANFGLQATQPHLEYGSVYREKRPTTSGLRGTRRRAAARTGRTVPPPSVVPVGRDPPHAKARGRPLRISYPADLRRRGPDTYDFRPADRTDDCSASDFVISEALQQTDFDGIRHGVLSGLIALPEHQPSQTRRGTTVHKPRRGSSIWTVDLSHRPADWTPPPPSYALARPVRRSPPDFRPA